MITVLEEGISGRLKSRFPNCFKHFCFMMYYRV